MLKGAAAITREMERRIDGLRNLVWSAKLRDRARGSTMQFDAHTIVALLDAYDALLVRSGAARAERHHHGDAMTDEQKRATLRPGHYTPTTLAIEIVRQLTGLSLEDLKRAIAGAEAHHCHCHLPAWLTEQLDRIERMLGKMCRHHHTGRFDIHVVAVGINQEGHMPPIDHSPDFKLNSANDYAVLSVTGPKLADGTYVAAGACTWTSDDASNPPTVLPDSVVLNDDGSPKLDDAGNQIPVYSAQIATPGDNGNDLVTVKAAGMADCDIHVIWSTPAVGHFAIEPSEKPEA